MRNSKKASRKVEYKNLTKSQKIPVLGLGTWRMGGQLWPDFSQDKKYIDAIRYAIQKGITHIDTAEIYGRGHAEELVSSAIHDHDRKKLFITTKVFSHHLSHDKVLKACDGSLKRLKVNYVDLYLIHWPNPLASMKNVMAAFDKLVKVGKVRHIGVSNFSVRQLQNAQKYTKNKVVTNQVHYSLLHRNPEKELLAYCQQNDIILTAYSPLAEGHLAQSEFETLKKVALKYKKTPVQIALRWLLEKQNVITIPKASSKEHIDELLGSLSWKLKKEDQEYLSRVFC